MTNKDNGGPAFPLDYETTTAIHGTSFADAAQGMTLRDYFAAKFITGVTSTTEYFNGEWPLDGLAKQAYELADAMLEARK